MPNKNYISGRAFEYKVKKYLESHGHLVFRSAGSHSIADLISISMKLDRTVLIQCKHHKINKKQILNDAKTIDAYDVIFCVAVMEKRKLKFYTYVNDDDNPDLYVVNL